MTTQLTKSGFLSWKDCPKSFWLETSRPDQFSPKAPGAFDRLLMQDGYAIEAEARKLVAMWPDADRWSFQEQYSSEDGLHARADLVRLNDDGSVDLIEIKASTSLRGSDGSDHVLDACFQKIAAERAGFRVRSISVMHVDKTYRRSGEIDPEALLHVEDVTDRVALIEQDVTREIDEALAHLATPKIDEEHCECRWKGNPDNRCAAFAHLNPDIPEKSAHLLPRITAPKLRKLDEEGRLGIGEVTPQDVTPLQRPVLEALQSGEAVVNVDAIATWLGGLDWPLWFYDYETFGSAVPVADGHGPHQQMPVQFSLHRLDQDGTLTHFEELSGTPGDQENLVQALREAMGDKGTVVSWNMSFEKACNDRMAALLPHYAEFLGDINGRTVDLMEVFKTDWIEPGFSGSTSIKKVLPVMVPDLQYPEDDVHDGTGAILAWKEMIETDDDARRHDLERQLLVYCRLDSIAMVRIFQRLENAVNEGR